MRRVYSIAMIKHSILKGIMLLLVMTKITNIYNLLITVKRFIDENQFNVPRLYQSYSHWWNANIFSFTSHKFYTIP